MDFGKLPGLFDKEFVIGFVLPAVVGLVEAYLVYMQIGPLPEWLNQKSFDDITKLAGVVLMIWLAALALMALNRPILRLLSGYYTEGFHTAYNSLAARRTFFEQKYGATIALQKSIDEARAKGIEPPPHPADHGRRLVSAVTRFPDNPEHFLGTSFGNIYRAMEVYPRVIYGLDAVGSWARMEAVIPSDYRKLIAEAQSGLNFATNIYLLTWLALLFHLGHSLFYAHPPVYWLLAALAVVLVASWRACRSAVRKFGGYVSGAYDLYRGKLAESLGLEMPREPHAERSMWTEVSRMFIYRSAPAYERLTSFKKND